MSGRSRKWKTGSKKIDREIVRPARQQPGRLGKLRLDKNECVTGLDRKFLNKVLAGVTPELVSSYPELGPLYTALSRHLGIDEENLILTAGADGAIMLVFLAFVKPGDEVVILKPTFAMYDVYCDVFGGRKKTIDFDSDMGLPAEKLINAVSEKTALVAIPNPNSPTATRITERDLVRIVGKAAGHGAIVLIDEAYYGFYNKTMLPYIKRFKNLVIVRTFSKTAGLASLRIGFAAGSKEVIDTIYKVKPMYEVSGLSAYFAGRILENMALTDKYIEEVEKGKCFLISGLRRLGLKVLPSYANFVVARFPGMNDTVASLLKDEGVLIKGSYPHPCMKDTIRITAGPRPEMVKFIRKFKMCLEKISE